MKCFLFVDNLKLARLIQLFGEVTAVVHHVRHYISVAASAEAYEVIVLRDNGGAALREVERVVRHLPSQVIDTEYQLFRKIVFILHHEPPDPRINQAILVSGRIDSFHLFELKVPFEIGPNEGCDKRATCPVDVKRYIPAFRVFYVNEEIVDFLDWVHLSGERGS